MLDRAARNSTAPKSPSRRPLAQVLPARSSAVAKPALLRGILPALPNSGGLADAVLSPCGLPRESMPRIMNPAGVPLTDEAVFARHIPASAEK
jgi:hypothetical protein